MSTKTIIILSSIGLFFILLISTIVWGIGVSNKEVDLRTRFTSSEKARQTSLDNMWKKISQKYQLSDKYAQTFKSLIEANVKGREGGQMLKFSVEANPQLSTDLYKDVMATIDGERDNLKRSQDLLADIQREHNNLRMKFPSSMIVGSRPAIEYVLVTSTNTQQVLNSGKEDSVRLQ